MTSDTPELRIAAHDMVALLYPFEKTWADPRAWRTDAQMLRRAAKHLMDIHDAAMSDESDGVPMSAIVPILVDRTLHRPALMLVAFAIELILKALIVKKDPQAVFNKDHDLGELSVTAGLEAKLDQKILRKLTEFAEWKGRYPTNKPGQGNKREYDKNLARIENVLKSKNAKFADLLPKSDMGSRFPRSLGDYASQAEDFGGDFAGQLFRQANAAYEMIFAEVMA